MRRGISKRLRSCLCICQRRYRPDDSPRLRTCIQDSSHGSFNLLSTRICECDVDLPRDSQDALVALVSVPALSSASLYTNLTSLHCKLHSQIFTRHIAGSQDAWRSRQIRSRRLSTSPDTVAWSWTLGLIAGRPVLICISSRTAYHPYLQPNSKYPQDMGSSTLERKNMCQAMAIPKSGRCTALSEPHLTGKRGELLRI